MKSFNPHHSRRGAALVFALAIMVLALVLIVGFLSRVATERSSSGGHASSTQARLLADTAVQLVQAQIDAAARGQTSVAWSSQPGLIRTFDDSGQPEKSYKLYSDGNMQLDGPLDPQAEAVSLASWYSSPSLFTDINLPVDTDFDGQPDVWPILDPDALGKVDGFSVSGAPLGKYLDILNPLPMPVRWLYVLQDGQVLAPLPGTDGEKAQVPQASSSNPIIGRVAFWTDDESCKINLNTASEGTYWDVPKYSTPQEMKLAEFQPARNEFQGYPGHPATTSLSAAFPELTRDQLLALAPRLENQGSINGTVPVRQAKAVVLDADRLYATRGEILFSNLRTDTGGMNRALEERAKFFVTTNSRAPEVNIFNLPRIACWPLNANIGSTYRTPYDQLIAFCSTLGQQPYYFQRKDAGSPKADYDDILRNQQLYSYLQKLIERKTPGFGGVLKEKYGDDADQILTEIFDYIRCTNLYDGNLAKEARFATGTKANSADSKTRLNYGVVRPIEIGDTRGFGRDFCLTEAGMWFICTGDADIPESNNSIGSGGALVDNNKTLPGLDDASTPEDDRVLQKSASTRQIRLESAMLLELFSPMVGYAGLRADVEIKIEGLENLKVKGNADSTEVSLGMPALGNQTEGGAGRFILGRYATDTSGVYPVGGNMGIWWTLSGRGVRSRNSGRLPKDSEFDQSTDGGGGVTKNRQYPFVGEPVTITVNSADPRMIFSGGNVTFRILDRASGETIQTISTELPGGTFPAPKLYTVKDTANPTSASYKKQWTFQNDGAGFVDGATALGGRLSAGFGSSEFFPIKNDHDVARSIVPSSGSNQGADARLLALAKEVKAGDGIQFVAHPLYGSDYRCAVSFSEYAQAWYPHAFRSTADYNSLAPSFAGKLAKMTENYANVSHPDTPLPVEAAQNTGDWDNGLTKDADGPYINKPDEGNTYIHTDPTRIPYFSSLGAEAFDVTTFFSPNRIMPSPGMFGSLSTGSKRNRHWETLLFRRQPSHPGYAMPNGGFSPVPDYLLMDLFWMPVVEPYAVSEPLSTAGKINLNQQIIPFNWVKRETGLYGVLKNELIASIPNSEAPVYKRSGAADYRLKIDIPATLKQLDYRFDNSDGSGLYAFRTAAEICDFHIVPQGASPSATTKQALDQQMGDYWAKHALVGDNMRERIYTTIYPRLTARSNTYTVHYRAQSLKKRRGSDPVVWEEYRDVVTGEFRGSTTLERFVDPQNQELPDYAANPDAAPALDHLYRWRQLANLQFAP